MSIDDRIRAGLSANAEVPPPSVEHHLDAVRRRHRRHTTVRIAVAAAVVAFLALAPWVVVSGLVDRTPVPALPSEHAVAGTYDVTVGDSSALRGTWQVTLSHDGGVRLAPPPRYRGDAGTGATYRLSGDELTTDVFVGSPGCQRTDPPVGVYRVVLTLNGVRFTEVDDSCPARAALFGGRWDRSP